MERSPRNRKKDKVLRDLEELEAVSSDLSEPGRSSPEKPSEPSQFAEEASRWIAAEDLSVFYAMTCSVASELDLGQLTRKILLEMIQALGAERGILYLGDKEAEALIPVIAVNLQGQELEIIEKVSRTILSRGMHGETVLATDALSDPRFDGVASVQLNQMRSVLCLPLAVPENQVGALYLDAETPNAFPKGVLSLLAPLSQVAAIALQNARRYGDLRRENERLRTESPGLEPWGRWVGSSQAIDLLRRRASLVAGVDQTVLIIGETGSGRRQLARAIHEASRRSRGPFHSLDGATLDDKRLERMILGRAGSARRAPRSEDAGIVRKADHGTLYLSDLPARKIALGRVLARIVETGTYRPPGGRRDEEVDLRLILATRPDPARGGIPLNLPAPLQAHGAPLQLVIPPLRDRPEDIPALVQQAIREFALSDEDAQGILFTPDAIELLQQQTWPGNVRQLRQVVQWSALCRSSSHIDVSLARKALGTIEDGGAGSDRRSLPGKVRTLRELEENAILQALRQADGNRTEAARLLGIHRNTLNLKLRKLAAES